MNLEKFDFEIRENHGISEAFKKCCFNSKNICLDKILFTNFEVLNFIDYL